MINNLPLEILEKIYLYSNSTTKIKLKKMYKIFYNYIENKFPLNNLDISYLKQPWIDEYGHDEDCWYYIYISFNTYKKYEYIIDFYIDYLCEKIFSDELILIKEEEIFCKKWHFCDESRDLFYIIQLYEKLTSFKNPENLKNFIKIKHSNYFKNNRENDDIDKILKKFYKDGIPFCFLTISGLKKDFNKLTFYENEEFVPKSLKLIKYLNFGIKNLLK